MHVIGSATDRQGFDVIAFCDTAYVRPDSALFFLVDSVVPSGLGFVATRQPRDESRGYFLAVPPGPCSQPASKIRSAKGLSLSDRIRTVYFIQMKPIL